MNGCEHSGAKIGYAERDGVYPRKHRLGRVGAHGEREFACFESEAVAALRGTRHANFFTGNDGIFVN